MKNKREEEDKKRKEHRARLREIKKNKRKSEPNLKRKEPSRKENEKILIVCEGKNTEVSYFKKFKVVSADIYPIGEGYNTVSLVKRAEYLSGEKDYDQVWCVFDKDDFKDFVFDKAINLAEKKGFKVAYSNQAFEYWLILHFNDHQGGGMHRDMYNNTINSLLKTFGIKYDRRTKLISDDLFLLMQEKEKGRSRQELAINRAKRNVKNHTVKPSKAESSTTVYKLVEELMNYTDIV
ncbi:MAG: RloB family protein [Hyphomicrobiales bacterium]